jgi:hypothetical protein
VLRRRAADVIDPAAGRKGHDDADRLGGPLLGRDRTRR